MSDGDATHDVIGDAVLVLRIDDTAPNRPPVANPDADRVVIGNSVKIPVTANDVDPDRTSSGCSRSPGTHGWLGDDRRRRNLVRFTPNLPDITEPTPVTFNYKISDGHGNEAIGTVTVTVLAEALPQRPLRTRRLRRHSHRQAGQHRRAGQRQRSVGRPTETSIADPICADGTARPGAADDRVTFSTLPHADRSGSDANTRSATRRGCGPRRRSSSCPSPGSRRGSPPVIDSTMPCNRPVPVGRQWH